MPTAISDLPDARARYLESYRRECATTRRVLNAFPADQLDLRPHERSNTARQLAFTFVVEGRMTVKIMRGEPLGGGFPEAPATWPEILAAFDDATHAMEAELATAAPDLSGTVQFFTGPKQMGELSLEDFLWFMLHDQIHPPGPALGLPAHGRRQGALDLRAVGGRAVELRDRVMLPLAWRRAMAMMPSRRVLAVLVTAALCVVHTSLAAQAPPSMSGRPAIDDGDADPNHWESYFDYGVKVLPRRPDLAASAFAWASRLDPSRAEPLHAQWVAFHMRDSERFAKYLKGEPRVLGDPAVLAMDSLRSLAMARNPFVHRGLEMLAWDRLPGRWGDDGVTRGYIAYANARLPAALGLLGNAVRKQPGRLLWVRATRAQIFVSLQQFDSAAAELTTLRDELARRDAGDLVRMYESKEIVEYSLGFLFGALGRPAESRAAMERALTENLGYFPARVYLGLLAGAASRHADAVKEYETALEVRPGDAVALQQLGLALGRLRRHAESAATLTRLVQAEPHFAAAWLDLARARERVDDPQGAADAYRVYVANAPRSEVMNVDVAKARLSVLAPAAAK